MLGKQYDEIVAYVKKLRADGKNDDEIVNELTTKYREFSVGRFILFTLR